VEWLPQLTTIQSIATMNLVIRPRSTSSSCRMRRRIGKAMALSLVALVMLVVAGQRIYRSHRAERPIDETGVVTVVSVLGGRSSKFWRQL
jgi:hypothetical protein